MRETQSLPGNGKRNRPSGRVRNSDDVSAVSSDLTSEKQLQCLGVESERTDYVSRMTKSMRKQAGRQKIFLQRAEIAIQNLQKALALLNKGNVSFAQIPEST